jgi:hypothetical protein
MLSYRLTGTTEESVSYRDEPANCAEEPGTALLVPAIATVDRVTSSSLAPASPPRALRCCLGVPPTLDLPDQLSFGENPRRHAIVGIARAANRDVRPRTKNMEHHGDPTHNSIDLHDPLTVTCRNSPGGSSMYCELGRSSLSFDHNSPACTGTFHGLRPFGSHRGSHGGSHNGDHYLPQPPSSRHGHVDLSNHDERFILAHDVKDRWSRISGSLMHLTTIVSPSSTKGVDGMTTPLHRNGKHDVISSARTIGGRWDLERSIRFRLLS